LGLTKAWGPHPRWTIWLPQLLLGTAVSTILITRVRVPDQVEDL
uniref:ABC transporter permease n=1 Tax=Echinostoma caproni TaxID=27848 RepID=A0A183A4Q3_9TREM